MPIKSPVNTKSIMTNLLNSLLLAISLLLFATPITIADNAFTRADQNAFEWVYEDLHREFMFDVMERVTDIGDPKLLLGASLVLGTYGNARHECVGKLWATTLGSTGVVVYGLKQLFGRDRPLEVESGDPSFPSGHTSLSFATAAVLGQEYPGFRIPLYATASVIGFSRIYLGRHYPSDALAGAFLGTAMGLFSHHCRGHLLRIEF